MMHTIASKGERNYVANKFGHSLNLTTLPPLPMVTQVKPGKMMIYLG